MPIHTTDSIQGQLSSKERELLVDYLLKGGNPPQVIVEIGTWLGGGSTLHILRELVRQGTGHLWGVEADQSIYDGMVANIRSAIPEGTSYFTPLFGFSQMILPKWLSEQGGGLKIDFAFLDGGDSPGEQVDEFNILDPHIVVGGRVLSHDAKLRKGKWFVPFITALDHYEVVLHDISDEGLLTAVKTKDFPSAESKENARRILKRLKSIPVERIGRLTPRWALRLAAMILPRSLVLRVGQGRK